VTNPAATACAPDHQRDVEDIAELGGGNFDRGVGRFVAALLDGFEGALTDDQIIPRLAAAGNKYARVCTWEHDAATITGATQWARRAVERELRKRQQADALLGTAADEPLRVLSIAELLSLDIPPRRTLLAPAFAEGSINMIHGPRGLGKTNLQLGIAAAVASANHFLRWNAPGPSRVLVIDGELPLPDLQARVAGAIQAIDAELPEPDYLRFLTPDLHQFGLPDLSTAEGQDRIEPALDGVSLLILDNISTLFRSGVENEAESWGPVQAWALKLRRQGIATLFVHHSGKGGLQRGTSRREDVLDTVIALRRPGDYREAQGARFEIHFEKHRAFHGDDAEPFEAQLSTDEHGRHVWAIKELDDRKTERVAEMLNDGATIRAISKALGIGLATVSRHKEKATDRGLLK
jgi:hypothetical protein